MIPLVVAAVAAVSAVAWSRQGDTVAAIPATTTPRETATAVRQDLIDEQELKGTLGFGTPTTWSGTSGVITGLPAPGTVLDRGDAAWEVDGHPGPLVMFGARPMWRQLRSGVKGADVTQLEENLTALGYGGITVDDKFGNDTTVAVKKWQKDHGHAETGVVETGDVKFTVGKVRVAKLKASIGDHGEVAALEVTGLAQTVDLVVPVGKVGLLSAGQSVTVELPDKTRVAAVVYVIGQVATTKEDGSSTIDVVVVLTEPASGLTAAPVKVIVATPRATGALTVPIRAIMALAEGGYAVEKVDGAGSKYVGVKLGEFGDGVVQIITNEVTEGDKVVVAP